MIYFKVALPDYYFSFVLCLSHFILGILAAGFTEKSKHTLHVGISIFIFILLLEWLHQSIWQTPLSYSWLSLLWLNFIAVLFVVLIRAYLFQAIYLPRLVSIMAQKLLQISYTFHLYHFLVIHFFIMHREYLTTYNSLNFMGLFLLCVITAALFQWLLTVIIHGILYIKQGISYNQD